MKHLLFPLLLICIVLAAFGVRLFRVGDAPPSVNWDEAALGYNAYSLLKTGKDEYSTPLPVSLRSFDDYKPAIYTYLIVPWLTVFSLSDVTVRLPSVIFGSLLVFSLGFITYKISGSKLAALMAAVFVAFEPWAFHFSRIAFESNVATSMLYLSLATFVAALKKPKYYYISLTLAVISMYTYHSQRFIALPILLTLTYLFRPHINWKKAGLLVIVLLIPLGVNFLTSPITARLTITSILKLWPFVPKDYPQVIYNPIHAFAWHLGGRFLAYYSPTNLYLKGSNEPGQYIPFHGLLHMVEFPLLLIGLVKLFKNRTVLKFWLPIALLAPLPAMATWNWFSVVRTLSLYPLFSFVAALGVQKRLWMLIVLALYIPSVVYLTTTETLYAPKITYGEYQPGFERAVPVLLDAAQNYDHVIVDSPHIAPYIFILFYGSYDPALFQEQMSHRPTNVGNEKIGFGKFEFREIKWENDRFLPHTLLIGPTPRLPDYEFENQNAELKIADIYDTLGYISFRIVATK